MVNLILFDIEESGVGPFLHVLCPDSFKAELLECLDKFRQLVSGGA